jgi:hypothetical protein
VHAVRRHLSRHRWPAAWLVLLALAVRLIVPAGYMPMAGHAALEICAGQVADMPAMPAQHGMHAMHNMGVKGMDHGKSMPGDHDHDCGFAAAVGGAADLPQLILPPVLPFASLAVFALREMAARPGLGLAAPPPPKTGPPGSLR